MKKLSFFTEDLWAIILARLPLVTITTSKLVCKQWKSIIESSFFRQIFLSHHQNSHSSWSLMCRNQPPEEVVSYYGCKVWGLQRSLASYVSSFIAARLEAKNKIPTPPTWLLGFETEKSLLREVFWFVESDVFRQAGLVTRTKDGVVLGFKVVLVRTRSKNTECSLTFIIYSSETGLWSKILHSPLPLISLDLLEPAVSLSGNLHWLGLNLDHQEVVVSYDFYGSDHQCRVIPFPDLEKEPKFIRSCTTSGGSLMYMNIFSESVYHKLIVWKLMDREWQLVSALMGFDYLPLAINPFDGNTLYMWRAMQDSLASINLRNGSFELHNELERSRDGRTLSSVEYNREMVTMEYLSQSCFAMFVLPRWLYRIPSPPHHVDKSL
ncbi:F-box protein At3g28330-like [Raphanus sativus]|uniref:F-box protein At3g28330-like n=1 Tax=Raphanus sativus TaxID=3726 RepID=A0A6J0JKY1_RAPSA|nr:F-box protein At3g28330-like [Raphanus sativus]